MKPSIRELQDELNQIRKSHPTLKDDAAFVLWFLRAYIADGHEATLHALTGETGDKGIDAIYVDAGARQVHVVQGKFHKSMGAVSEKRGDVISFAGLCDLPWCDKAAYRAFSEKLSPLVLQKVEEMRHAARQNGYTIRLYYVTTGRCSQSIRAEATQRAAAADGPAEITILDAGQIALLFKDYIDGVAPAIQSLDLRISSEGMVRTDGVIRRYDPEKEIESWVFSMAAEDVGEMYAKAGTRLFARNVRGYLGESTKINKAMEDTIKSRPGYFWYFNNGVTIVCDRAERKMQAGQDYLRVDRPQVINGQQTTRTLQKAHSQHASVLVRVISVSRDAEDDREYENLVSQIVRATNWQNAINPSDLVSNDQVQVFLERELRKLSYQYLRKRQTKSEARRIYGTQSLYQIKKEELAQAVAACEFDPVVVREGKEGLFDGKYYRTIFSSRTLHFYLSRYWLMRQVQRGARGYPERAYAKWLVLHFAWKWLAPYISGGSGAQIFRYACERAGSYYNLFFQLDKMIDGIFRAALTFYRSRRGRGEEAKDVSTFFKRSKQHVEFEKFWRSQANPHKAKVQTRLANVSKALAELSAS
jgi:hypothetical protein